jgi:serine/threonine protein kinase
VVPVPEQKGAAETVTGDPYIEARIAQHQPAADRLSIPGFEILGELGRGGMGIVYKARQVSLNRIVALKTMRDDHRVGNKDLARFLVEAEAVAAIEHNNVVRVYEYGDHDGQPYMALEYLAGGTLGDRLFRDTRLPPQEAAGLIAAVARGVAAAHALRIVHRDLKPGNILFGRDESSKVKDGSRPENTPGSGSSLTPTHSLTPKVADFGLAKRLTSDLTQTEMVMGTPAYISPEQANGKTKFVGPTADVWALGIILYECLHGERPFRSPEIQTLLALIQSADMPAPDPSLRIPRELSLICRKCLEKNPADRYPTAAELADDLERFTRGDPVSVRPLGATTRAIRWAKRNPVVAGLLGMVLVVSLGLVGSLISQYRQALASADFERLAKEHAQKLAEDNATLAAAEAARRQEAERLQKLADAEAARANQVSDFMTSLFRGSDPLDIFGENILPQSWEKQRLKTADVLLHEAALKFSTELTGQPLARAKLMNAVANSMTNLGDYKTAEPLLKEAIEIRKANLPADHPDVILNELDLARMYWNIGNFVTALEQFRAVLAKQRKIGAPERVILTTRFYEALTLTFIDYRQAEPVFREVIAGRERLLGPNHHDTIGAYMGYVAMLLDEGRTGDLLPLLPKIIEPLRTHPNEQFRNFGEVVSTFQTGVGLAHMAASTPAFSDTLLRQAEAKLREALKSGEKHLPAEHWVVGMIRFELAGVLAEMGQQAEADLLYNRLVADIRKTYGFAHPKMLIVGHMIGDRWARSGRLIEARKLWDEIDTANARQFGPDNHWRAALLLGRVQFESVFGSLAQAQSYAEQALPLIRKGKIANQKALSIALLQASKEFARPSLPEAGRAVAHELLAITRQYVENLYGQQSREMCIALRVEGECRYALGDRAPGAARLAEAEPLARLFSRGSDDEELHDLFAALGNVANAQGRFADGKKYYTQALDITLRNDWNRHTRLNDAWGVVQSLVGQKNYREAIPVLMDIRKWTNTGKVAELDLTWIDLSLASVRLASGGHDGYQSDLRSMAKQYEKSTNTDTLARLAWALALSPDASISEATDLEKRLSAALKRYPQFAWGHWALALLALRAGDIEGAEAALKAGGALWKTQELALYPSISGLCAAKRGDLPTARTHLRKAEELIAAEKPSEKHPFAYADINWVDRLLADVLVEELHDKLAPREPAPPPRQKS